MIPKFLQPEHLSFASIEILHARLTDSQPPAPVVVCAWCVDFDPTTVRGASHGICAACAAKLEEGMR